MMDIAADECPAVPADNDNDQPDLVSRLIEIRDAVGREWDTPFRVEVYVTLQRAIEALTKGGRS